MHGFSQVVVETILQLLANSPILLDELHLAMGLDPIENPVLVVRWLSQSFFSQSDDSPPQRMRERSITSISYLL